MKNKKLLKTILCITSGIGFAASIPFTTTACGSRKPTPVDKKILPYEVYDINETTGVLNGFKSGINLDEYNDGICDTMQIPASVTSIGDDAFANKIPSFIKNLTFADGSVCSSIGSLILKNCSSITSIDLSNCTKLSSIATDAFQQYNSIKDIKIDNDYYHVEQLGPKGKAVISGKKGTTSWNSSSVIVGGLACGDIEIPDNITFIAENAFLTCCSITSVTFPSSLISIKNYAFQACLSLTSIGLLNSINLLSIENYAFFLCSNLTIVSFPSSLTSIGSWTFCTCNLLTSVNFPSNLKTIGEGAFSGCTTLNYITWNLADNYDSVVTINQNAFLNISPTGKVKSFNPSISSDNFLTWIKTKGGFPSSGWEVEA